MAVASWLPSTTTTVTAPWTFTIAPTFTTGATFSTGAVLVGASITGATITGTVTVATGATITNPTITGATLGGSFIGTYTLAGTPSITGAAMAGATTIASGATITTPTEKWTVSAVTATGSTGSTAAALPSVYPALVQATGVSGAGVNLPTGAAVAGAYYVLSNGMTGVLNLYSTGATINGTTGTTAYAISATGNKLAVAFCVTPGAWIVGLNT